MKNARCISTVVWVGLIAACGSEVSEKTTAVPPIGESRSAATCAEWPAAASPPISTSAKNNITCTWTRDDGLVPITRNTYSSATSLWASSPNDVYVALEEGTVRRTTRIVHFDGVTWTTEQLPELSALRLWGVVGAGGDVFVSGSVGKQPNVFRRSASTGTWTEEPAIANASSDFTLITGVDNDNILVLGQSNGSTTTAWRKCGQQFVETPMVHVRPGRVAMSGFFTLDARHIFAFGGGIQEGTTTPSEGEIFAVLDMFDGVSWKGIDIPVALTDIVSITGSSIDDLIIAAWNRNENGQSRFFHVTDGLKTWSPIAFPAATLHGEFLSSPVHGTGAGAVFTLGCDWPDQFKPPPVGCSRLTRLDGTPPAIIDPEAGAPLITWTDAVHADLHVVLRDGANESMNALRHYRAHCE